MYEMCFKLFHASQSRPYQTAGTGASERWFKKLVCIGLFYGLTVFPDQAVLVEQVNAEHYKNEER